MKDPRRLIDDATLTEVERCALLAARGAEPSPALVEEMWAKLAVTTGAAAAAGSAATTHTSGVALAKAGASKLAVVKALVLGAAVGTVTTGGVVAVSRAVAPQHSGSPAPTTHVEPRAVAPVGVHGATESASPPSVEPPPPATALQDVPNSPPRIAPAVSGARPLADSPSSPDPSAVAAFEGGGATATPLGEAARDEARLAGLAREMLARRDQTNALVTLDEAARRYPHGILLQEREALTISALSETGRAAEAAARARAFLRAFPNSPHAARVQHALKP